MREWLQRHTRELLAGAAVAVLAAAILLRLGADDPPAFVIKGPSGQQLTIPAATVRGLAAAEVAAASQQPDLDNMCSPGGDATCRKLMRSVLAGAWARMELQRRGRTLPASEVDAQTQVLLGQLAALTRSKTPAQALGKIGLDARQVRDYAAGQAAFSRLLPPYRPATVAQAEQLYRQQRPGLGVPPRVTVTIWDFAGDRGGALAGQALLQRGGKLRRRAQFSIQDMSYSEAGLNPPPYDRLALGPRGVRVTQFRGRWYLTEITRIRPAVPAPPFAKLRRSLQAQASFNQRETQTQALTEQLRRRWAEQTDCQASFCTPDGR